MLCWNDDSVFQLEKGTRLVPIVWHTSDTSHNLVYNVHRNMFKQQLPIIAVYSVVSDTLTTWFTREHEPHTRNVNVSEPHTQNNVNVSEPHTRNVNVSEPHTRNVNVSEPHTCISTR